MALTVSRFFERQQQNLANRKDGDTHRHVTARADTSWRSTAELTTNMRKAVIMNQLLLSSVKLKYKIVQNSTKIVKIYRSEICSKIQVVRT